MRYSHLVIGMKVLTYNAAFDTFVLKMNNLGLNTIRARITYFSRKKLILLDFHLGTGLLTYISILRQRYVFYDFFKGR